MSGIRVLLVDDQPIVRQGLHLLLEQQEDIDIVGEAGDGWEAMEDVRRLLPDVVLMDIEMPGLSGLDATRQICQATPDACVLILTIHDREELLFEALQAGALGYILKSADVDELLAAIRTVRSKEVFIYPRMATKLVGDYLRRGGNHRDDDFERLSVREGGPAATRREPHQRRDSRHAPSEPLHGADLPAKDHEKTRPPQSDRAPEVRSSQEVDQPLV